MTVLRNDNGPLLVLSFLFSDAFLGAAATAVQIINVSRLWIKKRPYGRAHQRIMICCYLQNEKKEEEVVQSGGVREEK